MKQLTDNTIWLLFCSVLLTCGGGVVNKEENPALAEQLLDIPVCGGSVLAEGEVEVRVADSGRVAGTGATEGAGDFCVDAAFTKNHGIEVCVAEGAYISKGQTYALAHAEQTFCTVWFDGIGEPSPETLRINWRSHAAYRRYRHLVDSGTAHRDAWIQARTELDQWLARYTGGSVLNAEPIDPTQDVEETPPMSPGLVAGLLDETWDTWPALLNKRLYKGEEILTPPKMAAVVIDADLGSNGVWDGLGLGGEAVRLPDTDYTLGPGSMRWAVGGFIETLVVLLRSERNRTGCTDQLPLVQLLSTANRGYFGAVDGQPYDTAGPAVAETSAPPHSLVSGQFKLVMQFLDAVPISSAELAAKEGSCYTATATGLDCSDPATSCTLELQIDVSGCNSGELGLPFKAVDDHGNVAEPEFFVTVNSDGPSIVVVDKEIPSIANSVIYFTVIAKDPQGIETMSISGHPGLKCARSEVTETTMTYSCELDSTVELDIPSGHVLVINATDGHGQKSHATRPFVGDNFKPSRVQAVAHMETPCRSGTCSAYTWADATRSRLLSSASLADGGLCDIELPDDYAGHVELVVTDCLSYSVALATDLQSAAGQALSTVFAYTPTAEGGLISGPPLAINRATTAAVLKTQALYREALNREEQLQHPNGQTLRKAREDAYADWGHHLYGPIDIAHTVGTDLSDPEAVARAPVERTAIALYEYSSNRLAATLARSLEHPAAVTTWAGVAFVDQLIDPEYRTDSLLDGLSNGAAIELADDQAFNISANTLRIRLAEAGYVGLRDESLPDGTVVGDDIWLAADEWYWLFEHWAGVINDRHFGVLDTEPFDQRPPELLNSNLPEGETPKFDSNFVVEGSCVDEGVGVASTSLEIIKADGSVVADAVELNQCDLTPGCFEHEVVANKLGTGEYTARITCTDRLDNPRVVDRSIVVDVDNPECSLDFVTDGRETRTNANNVLEVGGTIDGGYIDVSGAFSDVGTGVDRIELTVNGGDPITVDHDLTDGTLSGRIDIPCNQASVVTLQVFDGVGRASVISTRELRCDAHAPAPIYLSQCVRQEEGIPVTLHVSGNSLEYDLSGQECHDTSLIEHPFTHTKHFNRLDYMPEAGLDVETQNLMAYRFVASDSADAGPSGVFVPPERIDVYARLRIDGRIVRQWWALPEFGGEYELVVAYQSLDPEIGLVSDESSIVIDVRLTDGINEKVFHHEIHLILLHPPVFRRFCKIEIDDVDMDEGALAYTYTYDGDITFSECEIIYDLDLPSGSLAPIDELRVEIDDGMSAARLRSQTMYHDWFFSGDDYPVDPSTCSCTPEPGNYASVYTRVDPGGETGCVCGRTVFDAERASLSSNSSVHGVLKSGDVILSRDIDTQLWLVPPGSFTLSLDATDPRAIVSVTDPFGNESHRQYDWDVESSIPIPIGGSLDDAYVLSHFDAESWYNHAEDGIDVRATECTSKVLLQSVSLNVDVPDMAATHSLYGDVDIVTLPKKLRYTKKLQKWMREFDE